MKIIEFFKSLWFRYTTRGLYVDLDPADTSITLSKELFIKMGVMKQQEAKVIVFIVCQTISRPDWEKGLPIYGFELNPPLPKGSDTPTAEIMFNTKHHCVGFETLVPTVAMILNDYHLPNRSVRLKVIPHEVQGRTIWMMLPSKR